MSEHNYVWPDHLMIRDTEIIPDDGGGRIYTTVGFGYEKRRYVRGDIVDNIRGQAEINQAEINARTVREQAEHMIALRALLIEADCVISKCDGYTEQDFVMDLCERIDVELDKVKVTP